MQWVAPRLSPALWAPPLCRCTTHRITLSNEQLWFAYSEYQTGVQDQVGGALGAEFLGSEPKFAVPQARPKGATQRVAAKLVSDPNNSNAA